MLPQSLWILAALTATSILLTLIASYRWRRRYRLERYRPVIITDTTVLVAFARIRRLPLLRKVYPVVIAPPVVWKETRAKMHEWDGWWQPGMARWITGWLIVARPRDKAAIRQLLKDNSALDRGEAEAIVLALELEASTILTDDGAARDQAEALGLDYTGTIGILFKAKERGFIATIEPLLKKMRATRFSISKALYERTLRRAGEL